MTYSAPVRHRSRLGSGEANRTAVIAEAPGFSLVISGFITGSDQIQHNAEPILNLVHRRRRDLSPALSKPLLGDDVNLLGQATLRVRRPPSGASIGTCKATPRSRV